MYGTIRISGTALAKKLGIKDRFKIRLVNEPAYYFDLFTDLPEHVEILTNKKNTKNLVHYFTKKSTELHKDIQSLRQEIYPSGLLWISWPKKASKIETDVTEDIIRNVALANGLVDIKACAIDEIWSGLKLVVPVKDRDASC